MKKTFLLILLLMPTLVIAEPQPVPLLVPSADTLPAGELGKSIARGRDYLEKTAQLLPGFVGNGLTCKNCHLGTGTVAAAAPWVGVIGRYPLYSARDGQVTVLEQRINSCFERSMNGKSLPTDHPAMVDMVAYMTWLSQGVPVGSKVAGQGVPLLSLARAANPAQGKTIYQNKCAGCHGDNGAGLKSDDGSYAFPPLWGNQSFNVAAGMARHYTAAGFIKHNMPLGDGGSLSDDEAWDVSAYVIQQPRPDFPGKQGDWPKGGKPKDARY